MKFINDFVSIGYGIETLDREADLVTLQEGGDGPVDRSSPAAMQAGRAAYFYRLFADHATEQGDVEQACAQTLLGARRRW